MPHRPLLRSTSLLFVLAVLSAAPTRLHAQFDGPQAEVVRAREVAFAKTMADRDLPGFLSFIAPDAVFFNGNEALRGRAAIEAAWSGFFQGPQAPFSWSPDLVQVIDSGGLALTSGAVVRADGTAAGRFNSVWKRDADGAWWVVFDKGS